MNAKDIEALRAFYVENRQQLYTYAVSLTKSREAAEDAIQGVFEKLLRGTTLPHDLRPYVFRSVRNGTLDGWRHAKVRQPPRPRLSRIDAVEPRMDTDEHESKTASDLVLSSRH